jgi:hypothetical protein
MTQKSTTQWVALSNGRSTIQVHSEHVDNWKAKGYNAIVDAGLQIPGQARNDGKKTSAAVKVAPNTTKPAATRVAQAPAVDGPFGN